MSNYDYKIKVFLEDQIQQISQPNILEFGVREGRSTKIFLDLCKKKGGHLFSVDVDDYTIEESTDNCLDYFCVATK